MNKKIENMDIYDLTEKISLSEMGISGGLIFGGSGTGALGVEVYRCLFDSAYTSSNGIWITILIMYALGLGMSIPLLCAKSKLEEEKEKRLILGRLP